MSQLQEEVHLLRQMKDMLTKDLEEAHGGKSPEILSATELKVQLAQKEQELARAKEALQGKKRPAVSLSFSYSRLVACEDGKSQFFQPSCVARFCFYF